MSPLYYSNHCHFNTYWSFGMFT